MNSSIARSTSSASSSVAERRQAFFNPGNQSYQSYQSMPGIIENGDRKLKAPLANGDTSDHSSRSPSPNRRATIPIAANSNAGSQKTLEIQGYVGFASIPDQIYRKAVKRGFEFTLMVVGQSGLGKSTFINSLFMADVNGNKDLHTPVLAQSNSSVTTQIEEKSVRLEEKAVSLNLTLVDTPGFGDAVDNSDCWEPVIQHVEKKFKDFFDEETRINRGFMIPDKRVHCCLYFIAPSGHGLKALDIEFMRRLHDRVNIIPVIAKADTLTFEECQCFKRRILDEIRQNQIHIYEFPELDEEDGEATQRPLKERMPFAIVGSNVAQDVGGGRKVRCRKYPWGVVEVDNLEHNDFVALRNLLIRMHLIDLQNVTRSIHYENFRCRQLLKMDNVDTDPFILMDEEKKNKEKELENMERNLEDVCQKKRKEKLVKLDAWADQIEKDIADDLEKMRQAQLRLDEQRKEFERERQDFNATNPSFERYTSSDSLGVTSPTNGTKEQGHRKKKGGTLGSVFKKAVTEE